MRNKNNEPCTVDGCTRKLYVKGMCTLHYQRFMKHGDPSVNPNARREPIDRFWEKVDKTDGCWTWKAFKSPHGYPRFFAGDKREGTILAHRWIFSHVNGPIPQDMHVDHICRNRACVRPDHLRLLTAAENGLYAQQSCRWVAKSLDDIKTLAAENVKSISVDKAVVLGLIACIESNEVESYRRGYVEGMEEGARLAVEPATASGDELPPLPEPVRFAQWTGGVELAYTEDQMRAYARAAASAATKPTADLGSLQRYDGSASGIGEANDIVPCDDGSYVLFSDVQSLLATKPAAAPAVPEGFVIVPINPTPAMNRAAVEYINGTGIYGSSLAPTVLEIEESIYHEVYRAMLAAAPAASTPAAQAELLTIERIGQLIEQHTDRDFGLIVEPFARAIAADVASRCRAQGGITNNTDSGNSAASTTGAAQTAEQARDQALEEAAKICDGVHKEYASHARRRGETDEEFYDAYMNKSLASSECATAIRALKRPTPTHSSEAGDAN